MPVNEKPVPHPVPLRVNENPSPVPTLGVNVRFRDEFCELGAKVTWDEAPYGHEWDFWDIELKKVIDWLPIGEAGAGINSGNVGI